MERLSIFRLSNDYRAKNDGDGSWLNRERVIGNKP